MERYMVARVESKVRNLGCVRRVQFRMDLFGGLLLQLIQEGRVYLVDILTLQVPYFLSEK